jgi:hypothetical protein
VNPRARLLFAYSRHEPEILNTSVRIGMKWLTRIAPGDVIELADLNGDVVALADVTFLHCSRIRNIPPQYPEFEHDPKCHSINGLLEVLNSVYPEGANFNDIVVTVGYVPHFRP